MTWYFERDSDILGCSPRVASTSIRSYAKKVGWKRVYPDNLPEKPVLCHIRDPIERLISNWKRLNAKTTPITLPHMLNKGILGKDGHIFPQTSLHEQFGVKIDKWILFEDLSDTIPIHENKSSHGGPAIPNISLINLEAEITDTYSRDFAVRKELLLARKPV